MGTDSEPSENWSGPFPMIGLLTDIWKRSLSLTEVSNNFIIIHSKYFAVSIIGSNTLGYSS